MSGKFLTQVHIHSLRNISSAQLALHPRFNFFVGPNGSGKSSLLEAIYLLGTGHSYRTREISPLIAHGQNALTVFARTSLDEQISIQKSLSLSTQVRINRTPCRSSSELAHFLPCQIIHQGLFEILDSGASVRRSLLDWGLFHVKQSYHSVWKDYRRVLKQRNALLRKQANYQQCAPWDQQLNILAEQLHIMRAEYFERWSKTYAHVLSELSDIDCSIRYDKGWDKKNSGKDLQQVLKDHFASDLKRQFTQFGAHQADIVFESNVFKAKKTLSRGQQKIVLIALKLAQSMLLNKPCFYLFDDVASELDANHLNRLFHFIHQQVNGQFFFTGLSKGEMDKGCFAEASFFSINQGHLLPLAAKANA